MSRREEFQGEFAIGVVRGLRAFRATQSFGHHGPRLVLTGPIHTEYRWTEGENVAHCEGWDFRHPMDACSHGFYAYHDGSNEHQAGNTVTAVIEGYGETVVGTKGFRCTKARIVGFVVPNRNPWNRIHAGGVGGIGIGVLAMTCGLSDVVAAFTMSALWAKVLVGFVGGVLLCLALVVITLAFMAIGRRDMFPLPKELRSILARDFPGVPQYSSQAALLKAHPLYSGLEKDAALE